MYSGDYRLTSFGGDPLGGHLAKLKLPLRGICLFSLTTLQKQAFDGGSVK
jgi:hypothetical protein